MATTSAFQDTLTMFRNHLGYTEPLSYEEWRELPHSKKAAVLFVQFYDEITLAWWKANTLSFIDSEDGVSTELQYLEKNVPILEAHPERFTSKYIYRVSYNCLYCICHDRKCDKDRYAYEMSNIVNHDGEHLDLFDTVPSGLSTEDSIDRSEFQKEFWDVVNSMGPKAEKVIRYLCSNNKADLKKTPSKSSIYDIDALRDLTVSLEEANKVIEELKERFLDKPAASQCGAYISNFASLFSEA